MVCSHFITLELAGGRIGRQGSSSRVNDLLWGLYSCIRSEICYKYASLRPTCTPFRLGPFIRPLRRPPFFFMLTAGNTGRYNYNRQVLNYITGDGQGYLHGQITCYSHKCLQTQFPVQFIECDFIVHGCLSTYIYRWSLWYTLDFCGKRTQSSGLTGHLMAGITQWNAQCALQQELHSFHNTCNQYVRPFVSCSFLVWSPACNTAANWHLRFLMLILLGFLFYKAHGMAWITFLRNLYVTMVCPSMLLASHNLSDW